MQGKQFIVFNIIFTLDHERVEAGLRLMEDRCRRGREAPWLGGDEVADEDEDEVVYEDGDHSAGMVLMGEVEHGRRAWCT